MDPEIGIMRRVLQEWRLFGALVPLSCALLGWSAGGLFSRPFRYGTGPQNPPPLARLTVSRQTRVPYARGNSRGSMIIQASRDPFDEAASAPSVEPSDPWKGFDDLQVSAIWCQPDDPLAVIGGNVVRPGDGVGGFRLAQCGRDAVWITGPVGSRRLEFKGKTDSKPLRPRS